MAVFFIIDIIFFIFFIEVSMSFHFKHQVPDKHVLTYQNTCESTVFACARVSSCGWDQRGGTIRFQSSVF